MRRTAICLSLCVASSVVSLAGAARTRTRPVRQPSYDTAAVNDPATTGLLDEKAAGPAALRAQILLDRAGFSVGQIDGRVGTNTLHAVSGFRTQRGLPAEGGFGDAFWQALNQDTAPALTPYTIIRDDLKGPFVHIPVDMMAKAKLDHLGYSSPLDELSERFHLSPILLQRLNHGSKCDREEEQITVPNIRMPLHAMASRLIVSKSAGTLTVLDDSGRIIAEYPCTSGSEHDPLPIGEWKINGVARNPKFHYNPNLFWDAKETDGKTTIAPGPRNPVGVVWIDLSKEHYGIHGTPEPSRIGNSQSHGCIRLTNWDAWELAGLVKPGTPASLVE